MAHPLDVLIPDPTGKPPLCGESLFQELLEGLVTDEAPQLFAIAQEYGERVDCRIAAWGLAFANHAEVVSVQGGLRMRLAEPEDALCCFNMGSFVRAPRVAQLGWTQRVMLGRQRFVV